MASRTTTPSCENCQTSASAHYCHDCKSYLCSSCSHVIHLPRILSSHSLTSLAIFCSKHLSENLEWYCLTCQQLYCQLCAHPSHSSHDLIPSSERFRIIQQRFLDEFQYASVANQQNEIYIRSIDSSIDLIGYYYDPKQSQTDSTSTSNQFLSQRNGIISYCETLHQLVTQFETDLLSRFDKYCDWKSTKLFERKQQIFSLLNRFQNYESRMKTIFPSGLPVPSSDSSPSLTSPSNPSPTLNPSSSSNLKEEEGKGEQEKKTPVLEAPQVDLEQADEIEQLYHALFQLNSLWQPLELLDNDSTIPLVLKSSLEDVTQCFGEHAYLFNGPIWVPIDLQLTNSPIGPKISWNLLKRKKLEDGNFDTDSVAPTAASTKELKECTKEILFYHLLVKFISSETRTSMASYRPSLTRCLAPHNEGHPVPVDITKLPKDEITVFPVHHSVVDTLPTQSIYIPSTLVTTHTPQSHSSSETHTPPSVLSSSSQNSPLPPLGPAPSPPEVGVICEGESSSKSSLNWFQNLSFDFLFSLSAHPSCFAPMEPTPLPIPPPTTTTTFSFHLTSPLYQTHFIQTSLSAIQCSDPHFSSSFSVSNIEKIDDIYGKQFNYVSDFDQNGLLYYLGTPQYQTLKSSPSSVPKYRNPADLGIVQVHWSSITPGHQVNNLTQHPTIKSHCGSSTQNIPHSWMMISLLPSMTFIPTAYSLRHDPTSTDHFLRSWKFQGKVSEHSEHWIDLYVHQEDTALDSSHPSATWKIRLLEEAGDETKDEMSEKKKEAPMEDESQRIIPKSIKYLSFRCFRILMIGPSSNGGNSSIGSSLESVDRESAPSDKGNWFLKCGGIELYGTLVESFDE